MEAKELINTLLKEAHRDRFGSRVWNSPLAHNMQAAATETKVNILRGLLAFLGTERLEPNTSKWVVGVFMGRLLDKPLPLSEADLLALIAWSEAQFWWLSYLIEIVRQLQAFQKKQRLTPALKAATFALYEEHHGGVGAPAGFRKARVRLRKLASDDHALPLAPGEVWSDAAATEIGRLPETAQTAWAALMSHCQEVSGGKPTARWLKKAAPWLEIIGEAPFQEALIAWFPLVDKPRTVRIETWGPYEPDPNQGQLNELNADCLKGLVWVSGGMENPDLARALTHLAISTYRKLPGIGPRCARVGNACIWALGQMPGEEGVAQLARLKARLKMKSIQKTIAKALLVAAERAGMSLDDIEEISVPTYGLTAVGRRQEQLSGFTATLQVGDDGPTLSWLRPDGKAQKSIPKAVKDHHPEALKALRQAAKDIKSMLPAQQARLESYLVRPKRWAYPVWQERYLDHPLVGIIARRLIWRFQNGTETVAAMWHNGRLVDHEDREIEKPAEHTRVELWHPLNEEVDTVMRWRFWLMTQELRQPFKQAHREVYILTDAEQQTEVYSNRFAAHILKQHQFNALCAARGWKNSLRLMVDDGYPPATLTLPAWQLRAEFWIEGIGNAYGVDTNDTGTFLYVATDQVRFYPLSAPENWAQAGVGDYGLAYGHQDEQSTPIPLAQIPPLVFSEVMRDVDLFVGVASVGNDPEWDDGGPEGRHRDYWHQYAFGDLSATAQTRRQVLETLLPRLKIRDCCQLEGRFLIVQGQIRTYKIHLGSGNILMKPNDQYLCIVPGRGPGKAGKLFLPFAGDRTLAVILSKAMMLAEDKKIKDVTITRQIGR